MFQGEVVQNIKTAIAGSIVFFSNTVWYDVGKYCREGRPQMEILHVRITCLIPIATNTHSEYVIFIACQL